MKRIKTQRIKKELNLVQAVIPMVGMLILMFLGFKFGVNQILVMLGAAILAGIVAVWAGYEWNEIIKAISEKLAAVVPALLILLVIGMMIAAWMASGTLPMIIYYGLKIISPKFIAITAFLVTAILSVCTGTSWGSAGTIGVVLVSIASIQGANMGMVAGAVVSGAYFGDKLSPLSDTTNVAPVAAGATLYSHIKHMLWTTTPGFIISCVVFIIAGFMFNPLNAVVSGQAASKYLIIIDSLYNFNILLIIPIIIVLSGAILKKPTLPIMLLATIIGIILAVIFQPISVINALNCTISGFNISMLNLPESIDVQAAADLVGRLINRGGLNSMLKVFMISCCAMCFAGAVSLTKSMTIISSAMLKKVKSSGGLIITTLVSGFATVAVINTTQVAMFMTGEMFKDEYKKRGLAPENLSRSIEDCMTMLANMIPWSPACLYMVATLNVPLSQWAPWNIQCWSCVIVAGFLGYTGIGIKKLDNETIKKHAEVI